jgi:hypothetical protein
VTASVTLNVSKKPTLAAWLPNQLVRAKPTAPTS